MRFAVLGSGSGGNAAVVECGGLRLMIDAGLSAKQLTLRLRQVGIDPASLDGILLTHEHGDHVRGLKIFLKQNPVTVFTTAAFALDALAIAAQALIGDAVASRDASRARAIVRRTVFWGIVSGAVMGGLLAASSPVIGRVFTSDDTVLGILPPAVLVLGLSLPLGGLVFVLDGVLMGAGDARYLAWTSLANLAVYLPVLWAITVLVPTGTAALVALTAGFTVAFMLARAVTLGIRARSERWVILGA